MSAVRRMRAWARVLNLVVLVAMAGYATLVATTLPDRIATHFALDGTPNGWMSRSAFLAFTAGTVLLLNVLMPLATRLGPSAFNVPHKKWWLATEERRREMLHRGAVLLDATLVYTNLVFVVVFRSVLERNGGPVLVRLPEHGDLVLIVGATTLFVAALLFWSVRLFRPDPALE